ncbi:MAG: DEAD/DEAH box helicase, partial [Ghiorsea sp.]|nr:DEAD/DEAH box helicase [Ghiorsea sp.]
DVLAGAQTGTGKTAGFTLPMLHLLQAKAGQTKHIRALVLTPTRELAAQIVESVETYGKYLPLRSTVVFGGVGINPQIAKLRRGVDILVATPGRLLDLINQGKVDLSKIEFFVLDEADRMLDMGFIHDIRKVLKLLPKKRQNLLFSATFSNEIKKLASGFLHNPTYIEVARNETSHQVTQVVYPVNKSEKRGLLSKLILEGDWQQVLVFTKTKHGANRLTKQLESDGIGASAIHGNKSQTARTKALAGFKAGTIRVLVATDIAARGLDIDQLPHVVNYELPHVPEDYVHRIGRTGRAGNTGEAMSLVSIDEEKLLRGIERLIKKDIPKVTIEGFEATEKLSDLPKEKPQGGGRNGGQNRGRNSKPQNSNHRSQGQNSGGQRRPQGRGR